VQKARVSTEGVKVMALLSECVGARGFESETYFELALRDAQLIPSLESSTHINFGLTAQFIEPYFAGHGETSVPEPVTPTVADAGENPYWMEARDRNARTVRFAHCLMAYKPLRAVPNVRAFVKQVKAFRRFAQEGASQLEPKADAGLVVALGKCFSVIAYAQLVAEGCAAVQVAAPTVSVIFHGLIEDLSAEALRLAALFSPASARRAQLKGVVRVPRTGAADLESVSEFIAARYGA
jgi:acyl-CoA dehydrogenase